VLVQNLGTLDRVTDVAQKHHDTVQTPEAPLTLVPVVTCCLSVLRINHIAGPFKPDPKYDLANHGSLRSFPDDRMTQMRSVKVMKTVVKLSLCANYATWRA
jgi:hypothetical protein